MNPSFFYLKRKNIVLEPELQAAIDRLISEGKILLTESKLNAYNELIYDIKTGDATLWGALKYFRMESFNDLTGSDLSLINLKNPTGAKAVPYGDANYTLNGWNTAGVNGYLDTNFNINQMSIDSMTVIRGFNDDYAASALKYEGVVLNAPTDRRVAIYPNYGASDLFYLNENTAIFYPGAILSEKRLRTMTRNGISRGLYRNAQSPIYEDVAAVSPVIDGKYYQNAANRRNTSTVSFISGTSFFIAFGDNITHTQHLFLIECINIFFAKVGLTLIDTATL